MCLFYSQQLKQQLNRSCHPCAGRGSQRYDNFISLFVLLVKKTYKINCPEAADEKV